MRHILLRTAILVSSAFPVGAETVACENSNVTVDAPEEALSDMTCEAVEHAMSLFEGCNVPSVSRPVHIAVVDEITPRCVAVYHCGEDLIEVLAPSSIEKKRDPDGAFGFMPITEYFRSVIVHELSHVAFDGTPCPFTSCRATNEYVAYNLQVMSMTPKSQSQFAEKAGIDRPVSRDELSLIILAMAPDLFAQKARAHLSQREDPCEFIGRIFDGTVVLDYEHF